MFCLVSNTVAGATKICNPVSLPFPAMVTHVSQRSLYPVYLHHRASPAPPLRSSSPCQSGAGCVRLADRKRQPFHPCCFEYLHHRFNSFLATMVRQPSNTRPIADLGMIYRWTFGSILFLASWAVLMGPVTYAKHLISGPRLPFTAAYFGSIALTLFFAIKVRLLPTLPS